jgi:fibronectin type III domain protein
MSVLRRSVSYVSIAAILVMVSACRETTVPEPTSIGAPGSPELALSADRKAPTKPLNLRSTGNTSYSVSLTWDPSTDNSSFSYRVRDNWGREITVPSTQTAVTWKYPAHPPLNPGSTYSFSAYAVDASGNKSSSSNNVSIALPLDTQAPTVPTFSVTSLGTRHIALAWSSTDDSPFISYVVTKDGVRLSSGWINESSRTFTLLQPGTTYTFTAQARDQFSNVPGGNVSAVSAPFIVTTMADDGSDVMPPTQPSSVYADLYGDGSREMQFLWAASTDDVTPQKVIIYEIYVNGVHENTAIGTTQSSGYGVAGENVITVIAIDEAGNRSTAGKTTIFIPF